MEGETTVQIMDLVLGILSLIGGSALFATVTKNGSTNPTIDKVLKAINFMGANWGRAANKLIVFVAVGLAGLGVACANVQYTEEDCKEDIALLKSIAQAVLADEISDEEKAQKAELYSEIAARVVARGCAFVPPPDPADLEAALLQQGVETLRVFVELPRVQEVSTGSVECLGGPTVMVEGSGFLRYPKDVVLLHLPERSDFIGQHPIRGNLGEIVAVQALAGLPVDQGHAPVDAPNRVERPPKQVLIRNQAKLSLEELHI